MWKQLKWIFPPKHSQCELFRKVSFIFVIKIVIGGIGIKRVIQGFSWFGFFFASRGVWGVHHSRVNIQLPLKCCFTEIHKDDQSLTLYDEVFLKTRNLFETYQILSKRTKEIPSLGLSSIFVRSCAKKPTNTGIGVIRQWSSYPPYIQYRNMIFIGSWLTEWILEGDPEWSSN